MTSLLMPRHLLPPDVVERPCDCLWWTHEPRDHPTGARWTLQVLPTCAKHGEWARTHLDPHALRRLNAAIYAACLRARVIGNPASWRTWLSVRFQPCPNAYATRGPL